MVNARLFFVIVSHAEKVGSLVESPLEFNVTESQFVSVLSVDNDTDSSNDRKENNKNDQVQKESSNLRSNSISAGLDERSTLASSPPRVGAVWLVSVVPGTFNVHTTEVVELVLLGRESHLQNGDEFTIFVVDVVVIVHLDAGRKGVLALLADAVTDVVFNVSSLVRPGELISSSDVSVETHGHENTLVSGQILENLEENSDGGLVAVVAKVRVSLGSISIVVLVRTVAGNLGGLDLDDGVGTVVNINITQHHILALVVTVSRVGTSIALGLVSRVVIGVFVLRGVSVVSRVVVMTTTIVHAFGIDDISIFIVVFTSFVVEVVLVLLVVVIVVSIVLVGTIVFAVAFVVVIPVCTVSSVVSFRVVGIVGSLVVVVVVNPLAVYILTSHRLVVVLSHLVVFVSLVAVGISVVVTVASVLLPLLVRLLLLLTLLGLLVVLVLALVLVALLVLGVAIGLSLLVVSTVLVSDVLRPSVVGGIVVLGTRGKGSHRKEKRQLHGIVWELRGKKVLAMAVSKDTSMVDRCGKNDGVRKKTKSTHLSEASRSLKLVGDTSRLSNSPNGDGRLGIFLFIFIHEEFLSSESLIVFGFICYTYQSISNLDRHTIARR